jgi:hypothetical protein
MFLCSHAAALASFLKQPMKQSPKQIPRPNEHRNDKPPKKKKQVSLDSTGPRKYG